MPIQVKKFVPPIAMSLNTEFGYDPRWGDPQPHETVLVNGMVARRRTSWWRRIFGGGSGNS